MKKYINWESSRIILSKIQRQNIKKHQNSNWLNQETFSFDIPFLSDEKKVMQGWASYKNSILFPLLVKLLLWWRWGNWSSFQWGNSYIYKEGRQKSKWYFLSDEIILSFKKEKDDFIKQSKTNLQAILDSKKSKPRELLFW